MHWHDWWPMGWMWFGWIILLVLVSVVVWSLASAGKRGGASGDSPEAILRQRYARGEIDKETYESMLSDLRK